MGFDHECECQGRVVWVQARNSGNAKVRWRIHHQHGFVRVTPRSCDPPTSIHLVQGRSLGHVTVNNSSSKGVTMQLEIVSQFYYRANVTGSLL